jgi:hypothetical protein
VDQPHGIHVLVLGEPAAGELGMSRGGAPHEIVHRIHPVAGAEFAEDLIAVAFDDGAVLRGDGVYGPLVIGVGPYISQQASIITQQCDSRDDAIIVLV